MDARGDTPTPNEQANLQSAELAALHRMLAASEGTFSFSIAICNSPALRGYLISKIRKKFTSITVVEIDEKVTDIFDSVKRSVAGTNSSGIFITKIEKILPSDRKEHKVLKILNMTREAWQTHFPCPVVFWIPEYAATLLSIHARDLWSWVSHHFEFVSERATASAGTLDVYAGDIMSAGRLDADQKRFRIAELEQRIEDAGDSPKPELVQHVLTWLSELAYIYKTIGDSEKAVKSILKSLEIEEKLGRSECMANDYSNLGLIYRMRGDLDKAEQMHRKSMKIHEEFKHLEDMASDYTNLGLVYQERGDLDKAEQMHDKALEMNKKLGRLVGMAGNYGNLGLVYQARGDLDKAEQMHGKALEMNEKLGWLEGMASQYGNLGLIYQARGDLEKAEQMHKKSLELEGRLERLEGMASEYNNLGLIYQARGDLDKAEQMHDKALEMSEKLGRLKGIANQYGNLGLIYRTRDDVEKAREYWKKALEIFKKIGMRPEIEKTQWLIDELKEK
ncbi:MAG: tetratricopeptide repeat protein [Sedimentisphaerales bacterium]|nr:tetratricopeptide repeat protein [Sedimentisphaerales bacterium]